MRKIVRTRREFLKEAAAFAAATALASCSPANPTQAPAPAQAEPTKAPAQAEPTKAPAQAEPTKAPEAQQPAASGEEVQPGVPRNQCLILENPSGTVQPADDFNRWRSGYSGSWVCGLQQIGLDALWYIDPDAGVNGVWDNALASDKPIYNADFTQMTIKVREGLDAVLRVVHPVSGAARP